MKEKRMMAKKINFMPDKRVAHRIKNPTELKSKDFKWFLYLRLIRPRK
jgi:hypothetical protein